MTAAATTVAPRNVGRYVLFEEIARGGMATVHIGRLRGPAGFKRTVAIKRLHRDLVRDPDFVASFLNEATLAGRIQHPSVVSVLDVVAEAGELFLVMEYVHGESLAKLLRAARAKNDLPSCGIAAQIMTSVLRGLHAAHEARSDRGEPLQIVHRDVSPQNVIVGTEGVARVLDFGVAKAANKLHTTTKEGVVKGKVAYMPPEQLNSDAELDRRVDVYSAGVVFWEALTGRRLYDGDIGHLIARILTEDPPLVSSIITTGLPPGLDLVVQKALSREPEDRYRTALEFARAIEKVVPPVAVGEISEWVERVVDERLKYRADIISKTEKISLPPPPPDMRESMPDSVQGVMSTPDREWSSKRVALAAVAAEARGPSKPPPPVPQRASASAAASGSASASVAEAEELASSEMKTVSEVNRVTSPQQSIKQPNAMLVMLIGGAIVALGVVVLGLALVLRRGGNEPSSPRIGEVSPSSTSSTTTASPKEPSSSSSSSIAATDPSSSPGVVDELDPVAAASASAATIAGIPPPVPSVGAKPKPTGSARRNCNPPYTLDARGVRVLKRECL